MKSQTGKQSSIWGGILILFGAALLAQEYTDLSAWVWVAILIVAGFAAFGLYLTDRSKLTLLIPAYVLWAIAGLVALTELEILQDAFVATYVLLVIALPFLVAFLRNRAQWWALIPAYVLLAIGVMVPLTETGVLDELLVPAYVMFVIAIPFFVVYARDRAQWWALIPGGILAVVGLSFLIAEAAFEYVGAVVLVLAGAWMLIRAFTRREPAGDAGPSTPGAAAPIGPETDEPPLE
ncbi:MAG: hypothetical protein JSV36_12435 [Anaerolineae bacterium]|nr:MAG: hypothetical protein JSV36_12435 [Anaerolineae bacterium]